MEKKIILQSGKRGMIGYGHPWVFRSQIRDVSAQDPGAVYSIYSSGGRKLGTGYYNPRSEIAVRLLTDREEAIDGAFFRKRIREAHEFRKRYVKESDAYRVVFSESDSLPGLIVDRYGDLVVFQILTLGMDRQKALVFEGIQASLKPRYVFEKSDTSSRKLEGLGPSVRWWTDEGPENLEIREGGATFLVNVRNGHKTGFYLDQRDARRSLKDLVKDRAVLDCFSYTGGFSVWAGLGGARAVLGIDVHDEVIALARRNAKLNGLSEEQVQFAAGNAFEVLREFDKGRKTFDAVILDPPSFVKSRKAVEGAVAGYKEINLRALRILNARGLLFSFSCSGHMEEELFLQVILDAAFDSRRKLKLLRRYGQAADHPVDPFIPQTSYLKGFLFEVE